MLTIELLERSYSRRTPLLKAERDFQASLEEIGRQGVAGPIYQILKENGSLHEVPDFYREGLEKMRDFSAYGNLLVKSHADRILEGLEREGIPTIALKGIWLSERLYGSMGVRPTADIDLLVREEQLEDASKLLYSLGFENADIERHNSYHRMFGKRNPGTQSPIFVELHWHVIQTDYCRMECSRLWEHSKPLGSYEHIRELSAPDLFYTMCLHGAKHHMSSLKHVLDIARMIHLFGPQISYESLLQRAREDQLYGMVVMALSVAYRELPHLSRLKTFGALRTWFPWDQELAAKKDEDYRHYRFKGVTYYVYQSLFAMGKLDLPSHRALFLWRSVFPHPEMIRVYLGRPETDSGFQLYARWLGRFWLMRGHRTGSAPASGILLQGDDKR
ncbi:nucleotidyltransferase domain-containing protein [Cohnella fermenti]|nr:nucleotidyltransferase family protein [Cohnella fermenti]